MIRLKNAIIFFRFWQRFLSNLNHKPWLITSIISRAVRFESSSWGLLSPVRKYWREQYFSRCITLSKNWVTWPWRGENSEARSYEFDDVKLIKTGPYSGMMVKTRTSLESRHNPRNLRFSFHKQNAMIIGKINFPLHLKYFERKTLHW